MITQISHMLKSLGEIIICLYRAMSWTSLVSCGLSHKYSGGVTVAFHAWKTHRIRATLALLNLLQGTFLLRMNPSHGQDRFLSVRCWHGYLSVLGFADFSYKSNTAQLFTAFLPIWVLICTGDGSVCTFFMLLRKKTKFNDTNKTVLSWSRLSV
jgi:hypothetical protein